MEMGAEFRVAAARSCGGLIGRRLEKLERAVGKADLDPVECLA
jgi:hypothetical protein